MDFLDEMGNVVFEAIAKSTNAYVYATQGKTDITRWSRNAVDDLELPGEYVHDLPAAWYPLVHEEDLPMLEEDLNKIFGGVKDYHQCEYRIRKRSGEYVWVRCRGQATRNGDGSIAWFIGIVRELASREKVDYTTKLLSIYEFRMRLSQMITAGVQDGGILLLGVDNFTKINTMYSYTFGNQVLLRVAETLQNICPAHVELYRIEGDKFAFICPHFTRKDVVCLFEDAARAMRKLELEDGERVKLSASAGVLMLDARYESVDEIHKYLEHALSLSKQQQEGTLTFFSEQLLEESLKDLRLREELRRCVENHMEGFELYFQPIMKGNTQVLYSCEALLRWNNQRFPNTYPDKFIPILEETGLIKPVGKWVGETALAYLKEWRKKAPELRLNVNVSYMQIMEGGLQKYIVDKIRSMDIPEDSLVVEITESCDVKDVECTVSFVNEIRQAGIEIALDDFGTGYSSISILRQIPADWIKLDHNFVSKIKDNQFDRNIVQYLISLCHFLGYKVCVEGVEDEMCCKLVQEQNAEAIQGYYYSRPVPAQDFYRKYIEG